MYHFEKNNSLATIPVIGFFAGLLLSIKNKEYRRVGCTIVATLGFAIYGYFTFSEELWGHLHNSAEFYLHNLRFIYKYLLEYVASICLIGLLLRLTSKGVTQSLHDGKFKFMPLLVYPFMALPSVALGVDYFNLGNHVYFSIVFSTISFFGLFKPIGTGILFGWYWLWYWLTNSVDGYASGEIQAKRAERKAGQSVNNGYADSGLNTGLIVTIILCIAGIIWSIYYFAYAGKSTRGFTGVFVLVNIVFCGILAFVIGHEPDGKEKRWDEKRLEYVTVYRWRRLSKEEEERDRQNLVIPTWVYGCNIGALVSISMFKLQISFDNFIVGFLAFAISIIVASLIILLIADSAKAEMDNGAEGGGVALLPLLYMAPVITVIWAVCNLFNL